MYQLRAQASFRLKSYDDSLKDLNAAIRLQPTAQLYNDRAITFDALGLHRKANEDRVNARRTGNTVPSPGLNPNSTQRSAVMSTPLKQSTAMSPKSIQTQNRSYGSPSLASTSKSSMVQGNGAGLGIDRESRVELLRYVSTISKQGYLSDTAKIRVYDMIRRGEQCVIDAYQAFHDSPNDFVLYLQS